MWKREEESSAVFILPGRSIQARWTGGLDLALPQSACLPSAKLSVSNNTGYPKAMCSLAMDLETWTTIFPVFGKKPFEPRSLESPSDLYCVRFGLGKKHITHVCVILRSLDRSEHMRCSGGNLEEEQHKRRCLTFFEIGRTHGSVIYFLFGRRGRNSTWKSKNGSWRSLL